MTEATYELGRCGDDAHRRRQADAIERAAANGTLPPEGARCTWCGGSGYDFTTRRHNCRECGMTGHRDPA